MVKLRKKTKYVLVGISATIILLIIAIGLYIYSIVKNFDGGSDTWLPFITFHKSYLCMKKESNRLDVNYEQKHIGCGEEGIRLIEEDMKATNLFEILQASRLYYTNNDPNNKEKVPYADKNKIDFTNWQCVDDVNDKLIPISLYKDKPMLGKSYRCWPNTPLSSDVGITYTSDKYTIF